MSMCIILFDSDGCTAIHPTAKVNFSAIKGGQYHLPYRGKKHLVEVLEMNDNEKILDDFDKAWWASARGCLVLARKRLVQKEGGFLSCVPVNETMFSVVKLRRRISEGKKIEANGDSQKKKPERALRKEVSRCPKSISTITRSLPLLPIRKTSKEIKSTGQKAENVVVKKASKRKADVEVPTPNKTKKMIKSTGQKAENVVVKKASKRKADVEVPTPNKTKKMGTKRRTITLGYEGGIEPENTIALPRREPVFLEHLDADQRETVEAEINFYKTKLISTSTQTEPCILLNCDDEARAFERNKKWLEVLTTVKEIHKAILLAPKPGIEATSQESTIASPAKISLETQDETLNVSCNTNTTVDLPSPILTPVVHPLNKDRNSSNQRHGPSPSLDSNASVDTTSPTLTPVIQPWNTDYNSRNQRPCPSSNFNINAAVDTASPTLIPVLQPWDRDSNYNNQRPGPSHNLNKNTAVDKACPTLTPHLQSWNRDSNSNSQTFDPSPNQNRNATVDTTSPTLTPILQSWNRDSNSSDRRPGPSPNLNRNAAVDTASPTLTEILQPWNTESNSSNQGFGQSTNLNRNAIHAANPLFQIKTEEPLEAVCNESWTSETSSQRKTINSTLIPTSPMLQKSMSIGTYENGNLYREFPPKNQETYLMETAASSTHINVPWNKTVYAHLPNDKTLISDQHNMQSSLFGGTTEKMLRDNQVPHKQNSSTNATVSNGFKQDLYFERSPCTISSQSQNATGFLDLLLSPLSPTDLTTQVQRFIQQHTCL